MYLPARGKKECCMKILVIRSVLTMSFLEGTVPPYHRNGLFHSTLYTPMDDQQGKFNPGHNLRAIYGWQLTNVQRGVYDACPGGLKTNFNKGKEREHRIHTYMYMVFMYLDTLGGLVCVVCVAIHTSWLQHCSCIIITWMYSSNLPLRRWRWWWRLYQWSGKRWL